MSEVSVLFIVEVELLHTTTFLEAQTNTDLIYIYGRHSKYGTCNAWKHYGCSDFSVTFQSRCFQTIKRGCVAKCHFFIQLISHLDREELGN